MSDKKCKIDFMDKKHDRITVRITPEIRAMLDKQHNESEPDSLLIRRAMTLGLAILALADQLHLPVPKPNSLMSWMEQALQRTPKEDKAIRFIKLLATADTPNNAEVALLADDLDIDVRTLTLLRDGAIQRLKSGDTQNEHAGHS